MQGRPPVFYALCFVQRIKRKTVTAVCFYRNQAVRCCISAIAREGIIRQQKNRSKKAVAVRTVTRYFLSENVRVNGYDGHIITFSVPSIAPETGCSSRELSEIGRLMHNNRAVCTARIRVCASL